MRIKQRSKALGVPWPIQGLNPLPLSPCEEVRFTRYTEAVKTGQHLAETCPWT